MIKNVETSQAWTKTNDIVLCASKKLQPLCRSCQIKIDDIRVGMIYKHKDGFILMRWYHLNCTKPPPHVKSSHVEGLNDPEIQPFRNQVEDWLSHRTQQPKRSVESAAAASPVNGSKKPCAIDSPGTRDGKKTDRVTPASPISEKQLGQESRDCADKKKLGV